MKVLLATPAYGGQITAAYFQSVLGLMNHAGPRGIQIDVMTLTNESLITRGRNEIVATFLAGDWTDLLWVDADIAFDPDRCVPPAGIPVPRGRHQLPHEGASIGTVWPRWTGTARPTSRRLSVP